MDKYYPVIYLLRCWKLIRIAAVADVHYPKYASLFVKALERVDFSNIDVLILAGDMVYRGKVHYFKNIVETIRKYWKGEVISIFGNEEYDEVKEKAKSYAPDFIWLDDESKVLEIKGYKICFIGSRGSLERPTTWQSRNIPNIMNIYKMREEKIAELVSRAKNNGLFTVLVLHYAPTYLTLLGEKKEIWPYLASKRMERKIIKVKPDLVIHAHAHNSRKTHVILEGVPIYNVSIPATNSISIIEIEPKKGLGPLFQF